MRRAAAGGAALALGGLVAATAVWGQARPGPNGSVGGLTARFVDAGGARTRYYEAGKGKDVILLIHGARPSGTSSANTWTPIIPLLAKSYRVLAPDRLGHGMTENPKNVFTATAEQEHLYAFLRAMKVDRLHVMGQSTGAWHAAKMALDKPEMVRTLVIVDSATLSPPVGNLAERRAAIGLGQGAEGQIRKEGETAKDRFRFNIQALSKNKGHVTDEFVEAAAFMDGQPQGKRTQEALKAGQAKTYEEDITKGAAEMRKQFAEGKLNKPTLLYWGRNDPSAILDVGLKLLDIIAEKNKSTQMLIGNDRGHFHYREHPEEFVRNVTHFLRASGK